MKKLLTVTLLFVCFATCNAQEARKVFRTKIYTTHGTVYTGSIILLTDSVVEMIPLADAKLGQISDASKIIRVPTRDIREIRLRNVKSFKTGIIIGAILGAPLGAIVGYAVGPEECYEDPNTIYIECFQVVSSKSDSAVLGALIGLEIGAGLGALIGSQNKKLLVDGNLEKYKGVQRELEKYVLKQ